MEEAVVLTDKICPFCGKRNTEAEAILLCQDCQGHITKRKNFYDLLQKEKACGSSFWNFRASLYETMLPVTMALGSGSFSYRQAVSEVARVTLALAVSDYPILDVATGTGLVVKNLVAMDKGRHYVGLDYSREMLNQAWKKLQKTPGILLIRGDAHQLPFIRASFGAISCAAAFGNMKNPHQVIQEMARVTVPGGSLTLLLTLLEKKVGWNLKVWKTLMDGLYQAGGVPLRWFSPGELKKTLEEAGYVNVQLKGLGGTWQIITARRE